MGHSLWIIHMHSSCAGKGSSSFPAGGQCYHRQGAGRETGRGDWENKRLSLMRSELLHEGGENTVSSSSLRAADWSKFVLLFFISVIKPIYLESCTEIDETQILEIFKSPLIFTPFLFLSESWTVAQKQNRPLKEPLFIGLLISTTHHKSIAPANLTPWWSAYSHFRLTSHFNGKG